MDLRQLRTFVTIAEQGTVSRAIDELRVAQPALSRQLQDLEGELGIKLFDREGYKLSDEAESEIETLMDAPTGDLLVPADRIGRAKRIESAQERYIEFAKRTLGRNIRLNDLRVVIEAMIGGREIECGVLEGLDGGEPEASVPAEVIVGGEHEFYDFEAKYLPDQGTELVVPADLPDAVADQVREMACRAFDALSCEGLARVDFFVRGNQVIVNEVNTMPGFTPVSMFPLMWKATGIDYPALVDRLIQTALQRPTGLH